jgi:hypothetical protein
MNHESKEKRNKKLAACLFSACLAFAVVGTIATAFMTHPALGVATVSAICYAGARIAAQLYMDIAKTKGRTKWSDA